MKYQTYKQTLIHYDTHSFYYLQHWIINLPVKCFFWYPLSFLAEQATCHTLEAKYIGQLHHNFWPTCFNLSPQKQQSQYSNQTKHQQLSQDPVESRFETTWKCILWRASHLKESLDNLLVKPTALRWLHHLTLSVHSTQSCVQMSLADKILNWHPIRYDWTLSYYKRVDEWSYWPESFRPITLYWLETFQTIMPYWPEYPKLAHNWRLK